MKSKKATYGLLTALLMVWGVIMYNVFFKNNLKEIDIVMNEITPFDTTGMNTLDTFSLLKGYSDPFLHNSGVFIKNNSNSGQSLKPSSVIPKNQLLKVPIVEKKVSAKHIKYFGVIKNQDQGKMVGVLYVNNNEYLIQENMLIEGVLINSINEKELQVEYQNQTFTIFLEE
jgi:hypothetical protein